MHNVPARAMIASTSRRLSSWESAAVRALDAVGSLNVVSFLYGESVDVSNAGIGMATTARLFFLD